MTKKKISRWEVRGTWYEPNSHNIKKNGWRWITMIISPGHHLDATWNWSPPQQDTVCSHNTKKALPDECDKELKMWACSQYSPNPDLIISNNVLESVVGSKNRVPGLEVSSGFCVMANLCTRPLYYHPSADNKSPWIEGVKRSHIFADHVFRKRWSKEMNE